MLANIWRSESNDLHDSMLRTYQEVFDDLHMLKVPRGGNEILAGFLSRQSIQPDRLIRRGRQISQEKRLPFDLGDLIERGYRHAAEKDEDVPILTDADKRKKAG